ncbi:MAG: cyclic nucleotide-binding domain-containing protein, partial [Desulforhopalus sp.]|nr:cyclic nucleotide-binding domain-containing protein [Desulforhopalus sp.]
MKDQMLTFFTELPLFSKLPPKELLKVVEAVAVKTFTQGEVLFTQGRSKIDGIYILKSGEIELYYARDGLKTQCDTLGRGEIFG